MIHIDPAPEPSHFDLKVRVPGNLFLTSSPKPTGQQWRAHAYWRRAQGELHSSYHSICAYACHWIPPDTGGDSVEHFKPKSRYPRQAYEWSNYRLVCQRLNGRKGDHEDVLDPLCIVTGWFVIDFPSLLVRPEPALPASTRAAVEATISRLQLNDEHTCRGARDEWLKPYCLGEVTFAYLRARAPFLAAELERQGLKTTIATLMRYSSI